MISRPISSQTGAVIAKIEKIFESIADSLLNEQNSLIIPLKTRPRTKPARDKGSPEDSTRSGIRNITFPNKSAREAWKFSEFCSHYYRAISNNFISCTRPHPRALT